MTIRWVITHLLELPNESRIKKHYAGEKGLFGVQEHLLADLRDMLNCVQYFSAVTAVKEMKQGQVQKIARGAPKRSPRPGDEPEEISFATRDELKMLFPHSAIRKRKQRLQRRGENG